jgi:hypothetical protein
MFERRRMYFLLLLGGGNLLSLNRRTVPFTDTHKESDGEGRLMGRAVTASLVSASYRSHFCCRKAGCGGAPEKPEKQEKTRHDTYHRHTSMENHCNRQTFFDTNFGDIVAMPFALCALNPRQTYFTTSESAPRRPTDHSFRSIVCRVAQLSDPARILSLITHA